MSQFRIYLGAALWIGCGNALPDVSDAHISCNDDSECPGTLKCQAGLCAGQGAELDRPAVAFVAPTDGSQDVSIAPVIVVAFTIDVELESVVAATGLGVDGTSQDVEIFIRQTELDNIFEIEPEEDLAADTQYQLFINAGVQPIATQGTAESTQLFSSTFATGGAPDLSPPGPIGNISVVYQPSNVVELGWDGNPDRAGVLILRREDGIATAAPSDGLLYSIGQSIGNASVIASVASETLMWLDVTATSQRNDYLFFAFDEALNYAPGVRAPFIDAAVANWCTDENGTLEIASTTASSGRLWWSVQGETSIESGIQQGLEQGPFPLQLDLPFPNQDVPLGTSVWLRAYLEQDGHHTYGPEQQLELPSAQVEWLAAPSSVGPGGVSEGQIDISAWPSYDVEADTNPDPSAQTFSATALNYMPSTGAHSTTPAEVGGFTLRARPQKDGCPQAGWTQSPLYYVGDFLYVTPGGSGTQSGSDSQNTMPSISAALTAASNPGTVIRVAEGTYEEQALLDKSVVLLGSYSSDFLSRNLNPPTSNIVQSTRNSSGLGFPESSTTLVALSGADDATVVDGFSISNLADSAIDPMIERVTVVFFSSSGAVLSNSHLRATGDVTGFSRGFVAAGDTHARFENNVVYTGTAPETDAVFAIDDISLDVLSNDLFSGAATTGCSGVRTRSQGTVTVHQNRVECAGSIGSATGVHISSSASDTNVVSNNVIILQSSSNSEGFYSGRNVTATNNTIIMGAAPSTNRGISLCCNAGPSTIINNIIIGQGVGIRNCIDFQGITVLNPQSISGNVFSDCNPLLSQDYNPLLVCGNGELHQDDTLCDGPGYGSQNSGFVDPVDLQLSQDGAYRPTASSPAQLLSGGVDTSGDICGDGSQSCGVPPEDLDGVQRSCSGPGDCYSAGAYQWVTP